MLKSRFLAAIGTLSLLAASPALAAPSVVVSLKPIHSLVAGVMEGVGEPELLVKGAASEHGYALRPSDAARLEAADVVFWVGPTLETYLTGVLDTLADEASVVSLMDIDGLTLLGLREGGLFEAHDHGAHHHGHEDDHQDHAHEHDHDHNHDHAHEHQHEHEHEHSVADHEHEQTHDHGEFDAHIWLDPQNARLMVAEIVNVLGQADPENAERYNANGQQLAQKIAVLETEIAATLEGLDRPYFVFHDAYHYFEHRFDIAATGAFTINPEIAPGAARLDEIRQAVTAADTVCLFSEPQFSPAVVETIAAEAGARIGVLDPLGADIEDGPGLYITLMQNLAASYVECLGN